MEGSAQSLVLSGQSLSKAFPGWGWQGFYHHHHRFREGEGDCLNCPPLADLLYQPSVNVFRVKKSQRNLTPELNYIEKRGATCSAFLLPCKWKLHRKNLPQGRSRLFSESPGAWPVCRMELRRCSLTICEVINRILHGASLLDWYLALFDVYNFFNFLFQLRKMNWNYTPNYNIINFIITMNYPISGIDNLSCIFNF